jgi:hypothetical protein
MFYSETQFYKEVKRAGNRVQLVNQKGENIIVEKEYLDVINSHDRVKTEEKISQTDIFNIIMANPKTVMSVYYQTKDEKKLVRDLKAEKDAKIKEIQSAKVSDVEKLLSDLIDNPILTFTPGKMRLMKGYHFGHQDERGRIQFKDMEEVNPELLKGVDPRTLEYAIVNNIKYVKK